MGQDRLNIAMLSVHSCPWGNLGARDTGGMSVYIREVARELAVQGHRVDVYSRVHDPSDAVVMDMGRGARLVHLRAGPEYLVHKLAVYSHLPEFTCNLEGYRKENGLRYDLVYSHYWLSGWVGEYLKLWWDVPHVVMFHTLGAVKNSAGMGEDEPELRILTEKELAIKCDRLIATTEREREELINIYGAPRDKIAVVPCGVNLDRFRPMGRVAARRRLGLNDEKIVLFVGRIEPLKGLERLLRAMPYLHETGRVRLLIIGGDESSRPEIERLKQLSRELSIIDSVVFGGTVKHEELPWYYSAADVCVIPSYYESFGLVALESLACGTPLVATGVGCLRDIVRQGENGCIVEDGAPHSLAEGITRWLDGPERDGTSALAIRSSVSGFGWGGVAERVAAQLVSLPVL